VYFLLSTKIPVRSARKTTWRAPSDMMTLTVHLNPSHDVRRKRRSRVFFAQHKNTGSQRTQDDVACAKTQDLAPSDKIFRPNTPTPLAPSALAQTPAICLHSTT